MQGLASESTRRPGVSAWGVSLMTGGQVPRPHGPECHRIAHNSAMIFKAGKGQSFDSMSVLFFKKGYCDGGENKILGLTQKEFSNSLGCFQLPNRHIKSFRKMIKTDGVVPSMNTKCPWPRDPFHELIII